MDSRQRVSRPARISVDGPLAPFTDGMRAGLAAQGYAGDTITDHVHLLADLSGWLAGRALTAADLGSGTAEEFAACRRVRGLRTGTGPRAMIPVVEYLRSAGAAPPAAVPGPRTPQEELLAAYRAYLAGERGVSGEPSITTCGMRRWFLDAWRRAAGRLARGAVRGGRHRIRAGMGRGQERQGPGPGRAARASCLAASRPARRGRTRHPAALPRPATRAATVRGTRRTGMARIRARCPRRHRRVQPEDHSP